MNTFAIDYSVVRRARRLAGVAILAISCRGTAGPAPSALSVGGTYQTQVSLVAGRNTCGAVTVQNNPTVVNHSPGAHTLSLTHAGNAYAGSIDSTARFATAPTTISGGGSQYTLTINGQFTLTKEYDLLMALLDRHGAAASRNSLLREVWGYADGVLTRTVDSHVAALRGRLETNPRKPRHILTVRKVGYRLQV